MLAIADIISSNCVVTLAELGISIQHIQQITFFMPVFFMQKRSIYKHSRISVHPGWIRIPSLPPPYPSQSDDSIDLMEEEEEEEEESQHTD